VFGLKKKTKERQFELYDLSEDIGEENNLAEKHPGIAAKIKAIMERAYTQPRPQIEPKKPNGKRYR
jgi:hypothetical protein